MPGSIRTAFETSLDPTSSTGDIITSDGSSRQKLSYNVSANIVTDYSTGLRILTAQSSATLGLQWNYPVNNNLGDYVLLGTATTTTSVSSISFNGIIGNYTSSVNGVTVTGQERQNRYSNYRISISAPSAASNISYIGIGLGSTSISIYSGINVVSDSASRTAVRFNSDGIGAGNRGWQVISQTNAIQTTDGPFAIDAWIINYGLGTEYSIGFFSTLSGSRWQSISHGNYATGTSMDATKWADVFSKTLYYPTPFIFFGTGSVAAGTIVTIWGVGKAIRVIT